MTFEYPNRIINIDMDSTSFDFEHPIKLELARLGIAYADPTTNFYIAKRYEDPEIVTRIESIQNSKGFFKNLPLIDGFRDKWYEMQERGYSPRFCTKPLSTNHFCVEEKKEVRILVRRPSMNHISANIKSANRVLRLLMIVLV